MKRLMTWIAPPIIVGLAISVGLAQGEPAEPLPVPLRDGEQGVPSTVEPKEVPVSPTAGGETNGFKWPLFRNLRTDFPEFREWLGTKGPSSAPISDTVDGGDHEPVQAETTDDALANLAGEGGALGAKVGAESAEPENEQTKDGEPLDWESNVASREHSVARLSEAIARQLTELAEREKKVQALFAQAEAARLFAEESCGGPIVSAPTAVAVIPATVEEQAKNLELVLNMLKKMKPAQVAKLMGEWDDALVIRALKGLGGRAATPIVSKMPIDTSSRIMQRIATGRASVRLGEQP